MKFCILSSILIMFLFYLIHDSLCFFDSKQYTPRLKYCNHFFI